MALRLALRPAVAGVGPQHAGQQEARRYRFALTHAPVGVFQCSVHKGRRRTLHHHVQQRVNAAGQAQHLELLDGRQRVPGLQQLEHFVKQAALWHIGQQLVGLDQGRGGFGVQLEAQRAQFGRKTNGSDDAHRVFAVTRGGVPNHADLALFHVRHAAVVVDHHLRFGVVIHGVDGEVPPRGVFVLRAPDVIAQDAAGRVDRVFHAGQLGFAGFFVARHRLGRRVVEVSAEGRDLDHLMLAPAPVHHVHDAKTPPDDEGAPEQALDLLRRGVGGHVEVFGREAHQQVAHRAADDVGLKAAFLQGAHHVGGAFVDFRRVNAVVAGGHFLTLAKFWFFGAAARGFIKQVFDEFFDQLLVRFKACTSAGLTLPPHVFQRSSMRQLRSLAICRSRSSGLVATGCVTFSIKARSFMESV